MIYPVMPEASGFIKNIDGRETGLWIIKNERLQCAITNYGARLVSLWVPDKNGTNTDVALGFNTVDEYITASDAYYGATVGRYANRIACGRFVLNGKTYQLPVNNGPNTLHGGPKGFHAQVWYVASVEDAAITLRHFSPDGEEGFPGDVDVTVRYALSGSGLHITYTAAANADTIINLSNHTYFNLNGEGSGSTIGHILAVNAAHYTPIDSTLIPAGELAPVAGTPFDFQAGHAIGQRLKRQDEQLEYGHGYDHNFALDKTDTPMPALTITGDVSGITMQITTDQPGMQLYSGNFMAGKDTGKAGRAYGQHHAFVVEPQHFPDSPNQPQFPRTVLRAGEVFSSTSVYAFSRG